MGLRAAQEEGLQLDKEGAGQLVSTGRPRSAADRPRIEKLGGHDPPGHPVDRRRGSPSGSPGGTRRSGPTTSPTPLWRATRDDAQARRAPPPRASRPRGSSGRSSAACARSTGPHILISRRAGARCRSAPRRGFRLGARSRRAKKADRTALGTRCARSFSGGRCLKRRGGTDEHTGFHACACARRASVGVPSTVLPRPPIRGKSQTAGAESRQDSGLGVPLASGAPDARRAGLLACAVVAVMQRAALHRAVDLGDERSGARPRRDSRRRRRTASREAVEVQVLTAEGSGGSRPLAERPLDPLFL